MKKVIRLTESDLMRIVKRVVNEQKTHTGLGDIYEKLKSFGFKLDVNPYNPSVYKGDDQNGAHILTNDNNTYNLYVVVNGKPVIKKVYKLTPPNYLIDVNAILKDLGEYKTFQFKKSPYVG